MSHRDWLCTFALLFFLALAPVAVASDIVALTPADAYGFLVVRDMESASAKIERLLSNFNAPISLLQFLSEKTGLDQGIDPHGNLLVAILPAKQDGGDPGPAVLIPVTEYSDLAAAVEAEPTGNISSITLQGEDLLIAKHGEYALLMDPGYRTEMESIVASKIAVPDAIAPFQSWMHGNDLVVVLLPKGARFLAAAGKKVLAEQRKQMDEMFEDLDMDSQRRSIQQTFVLYEQVIDLLDKEVHAVTIGMVIDEAGNVRLGKRVQIEPGGTLAQLAAVSMDVSNPLLGLPDQPFVFAAGGPFPKEWADVLAALSIEFMRSYPELMRMTYGIDDLDKENLGKIRDVMKASMTGFQSVAICLQPGVDDAPIMGGFVEVLEVSDADHSLEEFKKMMNIWNEFFSTKEGTEDSQYQLTEVEIAGRPGLKITMDLAGIAQDNQLGGMFDVLFGGRKSITAYYGIIDDKHLAICYDKEAVEEIIAAMRQDGKQLVDNPLVVKTKALLPDTAPWVGYISPKGCVDYGRRILELVMGQFGGAPIIPEYPETPPIGFAWQLNGNGAAADLVVPAETIHGLSDYIREVNE